MAGQTFTTYINAKRTGSVDSEFAQLGAAGGKTLTDLQRKAESASKALAGLTGGRGTGGQSPISQAYLTGFDQATAKAEKLEAAQARLARQNSTLVRALRTTGDTLQVVQGPLGPIAGRVTAAADALTRLTGVTLGLAGAGAALFAYARAANHFVEVRSKLAPLYDTQEQVNTALSKVFGIAQRARAGLEPIAELYGKLKLAADQYGYSQERVARTTELAAKSATLSGGPAVNRERGLYQFTQAIGTGKLQGQDLRALLEDTPFLGREISLGISKLPDFKGQSSGSIGDLRKLATEGKITADVIMRALDAAAGDIETRFSRLPPTLSSAFTSIGNSATMFAGRFEESTHVVTTLSRGIMLLGNNLNQIAALAGGVAAGFAAVAAAGQFKSISRDIGNALTSMRAQQTTARAGLEIAVNMRTATAQQTVALAEQEMQIRRNIVALEAEVGVQRELAANAEVGAAVGLPGAVAQKGNATLAGRQATKQLADEVEHLSMVQTQAATAGRKLEDQHKAVAVATTAASKSSSLLKSGLMSLLGAFNPVGIAVALATSVFLEWAFAESEAEKAAKKVEDAQRTLANVVDFTTSRIREQNAAIRAGATLTQGQGFNAAQQNYADIRRQIGDVGSDIRTRTVSGLSLEKVTSPGERQALGQIDRYEAGQISVSELQQSISKIAESDDKVRGMAVQIAALGQKAAEAAQNVEKMRSGLKILGNTATAEDFRRAQGDFSGGKAQGETSNRNLAAESEALAKKLSDETFAAKYRENQQLADLEKRRSSLTADDYRDERAEIIATYDEAVRSFGERKDKEDAAAQRAHERELKRIEEENQKRAERTTKRTDILGHYADEPKPDIKAEKDIRTLNALIGQTMNGLEEITKSNPLGQGLYTKEMADRDAENIANGLQKPFADYLRQRERDVQISDLIVHGHDLEAEALKQVFDLHEKIGHVTMGQYDTILHNLQAEERTNDALAARERILAPLRQAADDTRNSIVSAIEAIENGGNPLTAGKNFLKGLFQQFNHASAVQLAEKITGGLDSRVRDLLRGSTSVDSKIAEYLDALNKTAGGAEGLSSNLDKAAAAADHAANALQRVADVPAGVGVDAGGDPAGSLYSLLGAKLPDSFYKPGTRIGGGVGDNIIYQAIGSLGAVITENLRPQSIQNALFAAGKTTARVSDHTTTDEAYDVRLPKGMSFAQATELVKKEASLFGVAVVKALNETTSGGTGPHAHYVFGQAAGAAAATLQVNQGSGGAVGGAPSGLAGAIKSVAQLANMFLSASPSLAGGTPTTVDPATGAIVVTGHRSAAPTSVEAVYNKIGADLGGKLDTLFSTKLFSKIGGKLGTAISGFQTGEAVAGVANAIGIKLNSTGSGVGGAIGGLIGSAIPGVGTLIGSLIGSALGGIVGNLFTHPDFARENIKGSGGQIIATPGMDDHGAQQKQAASAMSDAFTQSLQKIADTLGATIGNFAVSVGINKEGKYVVDPTGAGWISNRAGSPAVQEFATADEAVKAALADAISDGAIAGISAGARRLLASGKDIDTQLNKALQFQSVFKTLKQLKNPLGAAIDDLNTQFVGLISIFKEAGAAPDEWAQLKELYDLQRQQAVTQNQGAGIGSQITDYIKNMLGGTDSPLNKATVYQNSLAALNPLAADVNAGKAVDTDALLKAVGDFQSASQGLNGSSQSFFSDFDMLLALLNKAQSNLTGAAPGVPGAVAPSPFDDASMQALIGGTTGTIDAINNQTNVLSGLLAQIAAGGGGGAPANDYSAIDFLPTNTIRNPGYIVSAVG